MTAVIQIQGDESDRKELLELGQLEKYFREDVFPGLYGKRLNEFSRRRTSSLRRMARKVLHKQNPAPVLDFSDKSYLWYFRPELFPGMTDSRMNDETRKSVENIKSFLGRYFPKLEPGKLLHVVDWGSGNGLKGIEVLKYLKAEYIHLVDTPPALMYSVGNCIKQNVDYVWYAGKLDNISILEEGSSYKIHLLLGNTICNFGRGENLEELLKSISSQMRIGEYLLVEWAEHGVDYYCSEQGLGFMSPFLKNLDPHLPLENMVQTRCGIKSGASMWENEKLSFTFAVNTSPPEYECIFEMKEDYEADVKGMNKSITLPAGSRLIPARIQRFKKRELVQRIEKYCLKEKEFMEVPGAYPLGHDILPSAKTPSSKSEQKRYRYALFRKEKEYSESKNGFQLPSLIVSALLGVISGTAIQSLPDVEGRLTSLLYPEMAWIGVLKEGFQARIEGEYLTFMACQEEKFPFSLLSPKGETAHLCPRAVNVEYPLREVKLAGRLPEIIKSAKNAEEEFIQNLPPNLREKFSTEFRGRIRNLRKRSLEDAAFGHANNIDIIEATQYWAIRNEMGNLNEKFSEEILEETRKGVPVEVDGQPYRVSFQSPEGIANFIQLKSGEY